MTTLYKKIKEIRFSDGRGEVIPGDGEYAIFDGTHLLMVKEEDMSVTFIDIDGCEFQVVFTHETAKYPLHEESDFDFDPRLDWREEEVNDDLLNFEEIECILENFKNYISEFDMDDLKIFHEISKKVSLSSPDGGKFLINFGLDVKRKKLTPFLEIKDKSRKVKQTVFKIYLNSSNMTKIIHSIKGLKTLFDKEFEKSKQEPSSGSKSKQKIPQLPS